MSGSSAILTERGTTSCRGCGSTGLVSVLDLGCQPLANEMAESRETVLDEFPLHLRVCPECGLGQVGEHVMPERIFGQDYPYLSSSSSTWVQHARRFASAMSSTLELGASSLVMEIASNDGYLLRHFQARGTQVLGVEPAANIARIALEAGIPTVNRFFGAECAADLVEQHGHPALLVANNVLAHVPDLHDFLAGIRTMCAPETIVSVENPSFLRLMVEGQFDTIYHEHFSYLTAHSVAHAAEQHGLELVGVEELPTHGGSNRYLLRPASAASPSGSVEATRELERRVGLFDPNLWQSFAARSRTAIAGLREWLVDRERTRSRVVAYGAAAKGNTFLNAVGPVASTIAFAVDVSHEKQGRFLPGSRVPVLAPEALSDDCVDDVLILPWNLAHEIAQLIRTRAPRARLWVALPAMSELS